MFRKLRPWKRWLMPMGLTLLLALVLNPEIRVLAFFADAVGADLLLALAAVAIRSYGFHARWTLYLIWPVASLLGYLLVQIASGVLPRWTLTTRAMILFALANRHRSHHWYASNAIREDVQSIP